MFSRLSIPVLTPRPSLTVIMLFEEISPAVSFPHGGAVWVQFQQMSFGGSSLESPGVFPLAGGTQESKPSTKAMESFKPHTTGLLFLQRTRQNLVQGKKKKKKESPAL